MLFSLTVKAELDTIDASEGDTGSFDYTYAAATINKASHRQLQDYDTPVAAAFVRDWPAWWKQVIAVIASQRASPPEEIAAAGALSAQILRRSSEMIPLSLAVDEESTDRAPTSLGFSYLWPQTWPSGAYRSFQFGQAVVYAQDFSLVKFDRATWRSLVPHQGIWQNPNTWGGLPGYAAPNYIFLPLSTSTDLLIPPSVKSEWPEILKEARPR
jgi:hypothetical protein